MCVLTYMSWVVWIPLRWSPATLLLDASAPLVDLYSCSLQIRASLNSFLERFSDSTLQWRYMLDGTVEVKGTVTSTLPFSAAYTELPTTRAYGNQRVVLSRSYLTGTLLTCSFNMQACFKACLALPACLSGASLHHSTSSSIQSMFFLVFAYILSTIFFVEPLRTWKILRC